MTEDKDKASPIKGLVWLAATVLLATAFAFGITPLVHLIPWSWEKNTANFLGSETVYNACSGDPQKRALLNKLVNRLYPLDQEDTRFSINVHIIDNPSVNAFAELGGKISLNRGLLEKAQSPEEIAGVLAHEITHVKRRHILEGFVNQILTLGGIQLLLGGSSSGAQWTSVFLNMGFTRVQEAQADEGALIRLQKAHINNRGFGQFFERLKEMASSPEFLSDHPSNESRLDMVKRFQNPPTTPIMTDAEWKTFKSYCQ